MRRARRRWSGLVHRERPADGLPACSSVLARNTDCKEAVLVFAHRQHPVIAKSLAWRHCTPQSSSMRWMGPGSGCLARMRATKARSMADAAEHIIRQAQRTAAVGEQLRVEQFVQGGRFAIGKQGVAGDFL